MLIDCSLKTNRAPEHEDDKDLVLLVFLDQETPCFDAKQLPPEIADLPELAPAQDKGEKRLLFAGPVGKGFALATACRLDDDILPASEALKQAVAKAVEQAREQKLTRLLVPLDNSNPGAQRLALAVQEGALLGGYVFDRYLTKKPEQLRCEILLAKDPGEELRQTMEQAATVLMHVNLARDLCNEPPNVVYPDTLAERLMVMAKEAGMDTEYWDAARLEEERCGGILAVGKGAAKSPCLVRASYTPEDARCHLFLVGKGVTYDTGGYSLKPSDSLAGMKYDMAGAAAVFAAACAVAALKLPLAVTALAPLAENDISAHSYHVDDVVTTRKGVSVEVLNTDAEGRMLLADGLTLACEAQPDYLVDVATLTGAAVVGLGEDIAAVYGSDAALTAQLLTAAADAGEHFWEMPLHLPYAEKLKATVADTNNTGKTRLGGSILAALFLRKFIADNQKWLHLDIAGPGGKEDPLGCLGKGGKGFGVRTLVELAALLAQP